MDYKVSDFPNHYLLSARNRGMTRYFLGDIVTIILFVNDSVSKWTEKDKKAYLEVHDAMLLKVKKAAENQGVELQLRRASRDITIDYEYSNLNAYPTATRIANIMGYNSLADYQNAYEEYYKCDEAPIIFVFNKRFRSFAMLADNSYPHSDEGSVVFKNKSDGKFYETTILHELLHQFGARDYYYPEKMKKLSEKYLPDSIMCSGGRIDSLTSYIIGWKNCLDRNAYDFLKHTYSITEKDVAEALKGIWNKE